MLVCPRCVNVELSTPSAVTTKLARLNDTRNIEPIPLVIHQLIAKSFAYCPSLRNPLVQQIVNYTPADLTPVYLKHNRKRTKHILL